MNARIIKTALERTGFAAAVVAIFTFSVFPLYWALITSWQKGSEVYTVRYLPSAISWANYRAVFIEQSFGHNLVNSALVAAGTVAVSLALSVFAAYGLGRVRFRGRMLLLFTILGASMFPQIAVLSGLFELIGWMGLYNRLPGLVLAYLIFTLPFSVWVLTIFMQRLPREIEEAALVDGASPRVVVLRILVPLVRPAMVTTGLLAFIAAWNEFLFALTLTLTDRARTVPVAISLITGASQYELPWGRVMAASVIVTVPLVLLVLVFQRRIVSGLILGGVKG